MHVPLSPPSWHDTMLSLTPGRMTVLLDAVSGQQDAYHHWDKVIHLTPPAGLTSLEWWAALKIRRLTGQRPVPLRDTGGRQFVVGTPGQVQEALHKADMMLAGRISMPESITTPGVRDRYIVSSLIEEAITSSQLEGAVTSRRVAKELLRSGRAPRDRSERMISNNYAAMQLVRRSLDQPLTPSLVLELHRVVTEGTLDDPTCAGRLERPDEVRVRVWGDEDQVLHTPPPAEELPERLAALCAFANGESDDGFVHPVLRAIVLHFWMGYDHYFADGNGRAARAVFYWSMLRQGYWLAEFLTISSILRKAPISYARSFLLTESDDNDLTYFVIDQLAVLGRALEGLHDYLAHKTQEVRQLEGLLKDGSGLNARQRAVLGEALRDADRVFSINEHRAEHGVVYQTARTDLLGLEERGLLTRRKTGKSFLFVAPSNLSERLGSY